MRLMLLASATLGCALFLMAWIPAGPAFAQGIILIEGQGLDEPLVISGVRSDDPLFHRDPGQNLDVAQCRVQIEAPKQLFVDILNGYPGYICTLSLTIHNRGDQAVRLADTQISAGLGLEVTLVNATDDGLIAAGQKSQRSFRVFILPHASEMAKFSFQIYEIYRLEETGLTAR